MNLIYLLGLLFFTSTIAAASGLESPRTPPKSCESIISDIPTDPHELVQARRIIINSSSQQATVNHYSARAYDLRSPSDIFKPEFVVENVYYSIRFEQDTGVLTLSASMNQVVGILRPSESNQFWLTIGDDTSPEEVLCH